MENSNLNFIIKTLKGETNLIDVEWFETLGFLYTHRVAGLFYNRAKQLNIGSSDTSFNAFKILLHILS